MVPYSESEVRKVAADFANCLAQSNQGNLNLLLACYMAAADVLRHFLTMQWTSQHVFGRGDASPFLRSGAYKQSEADSKMDRLRHTCRVIKLAEMLLNFQTIEGIQGRIGRMQTECVESVVADLECAELLYRSGVPFRFVLEQNERGLDYDLEATLGTAIVPCEVKCKLEATELTEETMKHALDKARKQLPRDKPCIVFLKIPETWVSDETINAKFQAVLADVFRNSGRISAVIVRWELWQDLGGESATYQCLFRTEHNPKARQPLTEHGMIVKTLMEFDRWRSIDGILMGH